MTLLGMATATSKLRKWRGSLFAFAIGQPAVQTLNLLTGFLLLRWLGKGEYAMFGVAFAFQSTINQLTDVGFSGSIVALAGERGTDPDWLGRYLRSARHYRGRMMAVMLAVSIMAFPLMTWRHDWGTRTKLLLFGAIAVAVVFQGWMMYGSSLLVHRRLGSYYKPQIISAAIRLGACLALYVTGMLSAWTAAWLGALAIGFVGLSFRRAAREFVHEPAESEPEANQEMLRYLAPLMPGVVFGAMQGQITVGIITLFGSTEKIAEIAALGRIGQLFLLLSAFNAVMLEPYFARLPARLLARRYAQAIAGAVLLASTIAMVGFMFPRPLLWLLGAKYAGLEKETGWVVLTACIGYLSGVMWTIHAARRWIFWWATTAYIAALASVQIACVLTMDLSQTMPVILFGMTSALAVMCVHIANGIYGLYGNAVGRGQGV
jgi:O-antigen/teichoic acid export membrane protein